MAWSTLEHFGVASVLTAMLSLCSEADSSIYTLYRTSSTGIPELMRIHVATFDTDEGE